MQIISSHVLLNTMIAKTSINKFKGPSTRMTHQRSIIFEIVRNADKHMDVCEIYSKARQEEGHISLSTVYRTLNKFKELGLVDEQHLGQNHHHYETRQQSEHYHMICQRCGHIIEFEYPLTQRLKRDIGQARDFEILTAELNITGLCRKCHER